MDTSQTNDRTNVAAWLPGKGAALEVRPAPYTSPREGEMVVRNRAVAINPIDWILQISTEFGFSWIRYPFVVGTDLAGDVVEVGPGVTRFAPGDRVLAHAVGTDRKRNSAAEGSFQLYTVVLERMAAPLPDNLSYERATVLPLGLSTAACGLFEGDQLGLDYPSIGRARNGKMLLVWGGSTSVGANAIQLAVAAGYDVITPASPKNLDFVTNLGASRVFGYNSATVVPDLIAAFAGATCAGAIAVGATSAEACVDVVGASKGEKTVVMATYPISFEGLEGPPGIGFRLGTIRRFLWFSAAMAVKTRRLGVRTKYIFGSSLVWNDVGRAIYQDFLPRALALQRYVTAPEPVVAGTGLSAIQEALGRQRSGVSASKIVVSLPL